MEIRISMPTHMKATPKSPSSALSMNGYRNAHYRVLSNLKKTYFEEVKKQIGSASSLHDGPVVVQCKYFAPRGGTDLDNFTVVHEKFFMDSIVKLGYIRDDNCDVVVKITKEFVRVDRGNPRVEITAKSID